MLKVPSFGMNACPETFVSLIHCVVDYIYAKPCQTFVRRCFSSSTP